MGLRSRLRDGVRAFVEPRPVVATAPAAPVVELAEPRPRPRVASADPTRFGVRAIQSTAWTRSLKPENLALYLRGALDGQPQTQAELFLEMEDRDLQLITVLSTRRRSVAGLPWSIQAASDSRRDRTIAAWCTELIQGIEGFSTSLTKLLGAITTGYAACEIDWRVEPGRVSVARLVPRPAPWFVPDVDQPTTWRILSDAEPVYGEPLQPGAWVWHEAHAKDGLTAQQEGLGRALAWAWLYKNYGLKDWVIFAEIYGSPLRIGKYDIGTNEDDRAVLLSSLQQLGVDAAAIFPKGTDVDLKDVNRSSSVDVYERLVSYCDRAMAKAVLGQTLTTEEGASGSRALGQVHADVRQDLLESDALGLGETLTRDLLRPAVDLQFGPQARYPRFVLSTTPDEDLGDAAKLYTELSALGVRFPAGHVHERFGIPQPKPGEATYGAPSTASPATAATPARATDLHALAEPASLPPMAAEIETAIREALASGGYEGWRTVLEHLRGYVRQASSPADVGQLLLRACETVDLGAWEGHIADELLRDELVGRAQVQGGEVPMGDWPKVAPRAAIEFWSQKASVSHSQFRALDQQSRARAFSVARYTTLDAVEEIRQVQGAAIVGGWSLARFEDEVDLRMAARGFAGAEPGHIQNVFRTNGLTAYQVGRWEAQADPAVRAARPLLTYDAVDDARTRPTHGAMDGFTAPADDPVWNAWYPPNGYQCRCTVRSSTLEDAVAAGLKVQSGVTPTLRIDRGDGTIVTEPLVPDAGFRRNPALEPHEFDFSSFPPAYRKALGVPDPKPGTTMAERLTERRREAELRRQERRREGVDEDDQDDEEDDR